MEAVCTVAGMLRGALAAAAAATAAGVDAAGLAGAAVAPCSAGAAGNAGGVVACTALCNQAVPQYCLAAVCMTTATTCQLVMQTVHIAERRTLQRAYLATRCIEQPSRFSSFQWPGLFTFLLSKP